MSHSRMDPAQFYLWQQFYLWHTCAWLVLLVFPLMAHSEGPSRGNQIERWDWYFRESLIAVDDWEAILGSSKSELAAAKQVPTWPVPADGTPTAWMNPIPPRFLPTRDRSLRTQFQASGDELLVRGTQAKPSGEAGGTPPLSETAIAAKGGPIVGYEYAGGGGRDQWYHQYRRSFDRLLTVQPKLASFSIDFAALPDFTLGTNELAFRVRNITPQPLSMSLRVRVSDRAARSADHDALRQDGAVSSSRGEIREKLVEDKELKLEAGASQDVRCCVQLTDPGGGLIVVAATVAGENYWFPLLTHVEDVPAVLAGIEKILGDSPDPAAAARRAELVHKTNQQLWAGPSASQKAWRELYEQACQLREDLLLKRIDFARLLFVKRKPFYSEQPFMDAHHCFNRPGGGIYCLSPVRPDGNVTPVVASLGIGIYRDVCLHWNAGRFLFAFGNGSDRVLPTTRNAMRRVEGKADYDLYEATIDGRVLRQLTAHPKNDCEPFYLPSGRIGFTSDRSEHYVMCGSDIHVANLFTMQADGSDIAQLSYNVFNEFNPAVLPDGRIIYNRWEYNERSVTSLHNLFTMRPDGTHVAPYYGNATIRPNVIMFPRPLPGSQKVMALFTGHHGQTHGPIGLIDVQRGVDGPTPITILTPGVPTIGEKIEDSRRGWYSDPQPLSETTYLCSFTPTVLPWLENSWGIYVGDRHGNLALVYRDPEISCAEPIPAVERPRPAALPQSSAGVDLEPAEARLLLVDVYEGLPGVARGSARYLRVLEDVPRKGVPTGGVICTSGTRIYTIKRVLGTVPIDPDGSAHLVVPADRNVYFEVLDENRREIQRMRSVVCLKANELTTCMGCHEPRTSTPITRSGSAFARAPSRPVPPPWGTDTISYLRDVQPVLNARCVRCHAHDRTANGVILTDDLTDQFCVGYEELLPYLSVADAMRWDHPDDVFPRPPFTYGSNVSPLAKLLLGGHYDVSLTEEDWERLINWIDCNAVYYDRYECDANNRRIFVGELRSDLDAAYKRRCAECHGDKDDGRFGTWWRSMNRRDVALSRALMAPLARDAGGWQRCGEVVFANRQDADYVTMRNAFASFCDALSNAPRADLLSLRGTPAEQQMVSLPPPPPPRRPEEPSRQDDSGGTWVYLSDLPWQKASSGWTPNKDGLPRRDKDVENQRMRFGTRIFRKGIGTHAPSEIEYALGGKYQRFTATIFGSEANGTVCFQVFGDSKLLHQSSILRGLRDSKQLDIPVADVQLLRLVVTDAGDGISSDVANWADARLSKAVGAASSRPTATP